MPEPIRFNLGTKEHIIIDLTDRLGNLTNLSGTNPYFSTRILGGSTDIQNDAPTTIGMTAYCLVDTTVTGYVTGRFELFLGFNNAPEAPLLGPIAFEVNA